MMDMKTEDPRIGTVLNERYRIIERIAAGGMAVVYRGERVELGRPVAIKFLLEIMLQYPKFISRFEAEARAMSKLSHPYCVSVIDFGVDGAPYIVMDYVEGRTLKAVLNDEQITPTRAVTIVRQILAGIAHAHSQGIIHRDIKPENVILQESVGVGETVRIFDFGLAKLTNEAAAAHSMSMSSLVAGTPNYMSPEQSRGKQVDERTDLYSICVVLFELLSGRKPFIHEDFIEVVRMHRETAPPTLSEVSGRGAFSKEMETVIQKALSKSPDDRYQTAEAFAAALDDTPEGCRAKEEISVPPDPRGKTLPIGAKTPFRPTSEPTQAIDVGFRAQYPYRFWGSAAFLVLAIGVIWAIARGGESEDSEQPVIHVTVTPSPKETQPPNNTAPSKTTVEPNPLPAKNDDIQPTVAQAPSITADTDAAADTESAEIEPEVKNLQDVRQLINDGQKERAIAGLQKLRREQPKNAQITFMIGELFFEKDWWSDALDHYAESIRLDPTYKKRPALQRDVIATLNSNSDKIYRKASYILEKLIGTSALPLLRRAAKKDKSQLIQRRAEALIKKIRSK